MIIRSLESENLFKYLRLELLGLPDRGCILLTGENESGKSSVLETLCFALFGRTWSFPPVTIQRALHWGATRATATVTFTGRDRREYRITRYIDQNGRQRAQLLQDKRRTPLAKGAEAVNQLVPSILGFNFRQFADILYLPQKRGYQEIHPGTAINALSGADRFLGADAAIRQGIAQREQLAIVEMQSRQALNQRLHTLALDPALLANLEQQRHGIESRIAAASQEITSWQAFNEVLRQAAAVVNNGGAALLRCGVTAPLTVWTQAADQLGAALTHLQAVCRGSHVELDIPPGQEMLRVHTDLQERLAGFNLLHQQVATYRNQINLWLRGDESHPIDGHPAMVRAKADMEQRIRAAQMRQDQNRRTAWIAFLLGGGGWSLWWLLRFRLDLFPDEWLSGYKHTLGVWIGDPALVANGFGWLMLFWFFATMLGKRRHNTVLLAQHWEMADLAARAEATNHQLATLDQAETASLAEQSVTLSAMTETPWAAHIKCWAAGSGDPLLRQEAWTGYQASLRQALELFQEEIQGIIAEAEEQIHEIEKRQQQLRIAWEELNGKIRQEIVRQEEEARLQRQLQQLDLATQSRVREVQVHTLATELLDGAGKLLASRFNRELQRFFAKIAPQFTEGRYQHLAIDHQATVQVFSTEKNHFVYWEELSTGVQQQLLLALRIALTRALTAHSGCAPQCLILDEPFLFFDRLRQNRTMESLARVSDEISQVWVATQERLTNVRCDYAIACRRDTDSLILSGAKINDA